MTEVLRVATVGTGYFSQFHYEAWSRLDVQRLAVCNRTLSTAVDIADRYGFANSYNDLNEMLEIERPDLLDIITPPLTHAEYIRIAAHHNTHVICQKPFTTHLDEAQEIIGSAEQAGIELIVHDNFRFQPWYGEIKAQLDAGTLGELYSVTYRLRPGDGQGPDAYMDRQPYFQQMERFLVHETAIHLIDVFRFLFGEIQAVFARLCRRNPVIAGEDGGLIIFEFLNGQQGLFDGNRLADHAAENRRLTMGEMLLEGSAASLRLDGEGRLWLRQHGQNQERIVEYAWENRGYGGDCVYRLQSHVINALNVGDKPMNTAAEYMANLRVEEAIYRSNATSRMVSV